jgi:hypothetical protein
VPGLLENELPDQGEEDLNNFLLGIFERSRNLNAQRPRYDDDVDSDNSDTLAAITSCMPTNTDYPLLRIRWVVSLNHYNFVIAY